MKKALDQSLSNHGLPSSIRPDNWFERHPKKTLIFLIALVFIVLDLMLAPFFAERIPNIKSVYYHHDLVANYRGEIAWGPNKYQINTNSLGFKDSKNRTISKVNKKYRILFIGDSFTEGVGFSYDDTFVGMIAKALDNSAYEVLNAGVSSYSPKLYYLKVKYLIEKLGLQVNEIFVCVDISDISDEIEYETFIPSDSRFATFANDLNYFIKRNSLVGNVLIRKIIKIKREVLFTNFYRNTPYDKDNNSQVSHGQGENKLAGPVRYWENQGEYLRERAAWTHNDAVFNRWGRKGFSLAAENMDRLNELCNKYQIRFTVSIYPWPEEIKYHNINSRNVMLWEKFCQERGINFLNCYPYFFTGEPPGVIIGRYFIANDAHFNLEGHKLMAKIWLDNYKLNNLAKAR